MVDVRLADDGVRCAMPGNMHYERCAAASFVVPAGTRFYYWDVFGCTIETYLASEAPVCAKCMAKFFPALLAAFEEDK